MPGLRTTEFFEKLLTRYIDTTTEREEPTDSVIDLIPSTNFNLLLSRAFQRKCPGHKPRDSDGGDTSTGQLTVNFSTDSFGGNLAEIIIAIADTKRYPDGYPVKLIARNQNIRVSEQRNDDTLTFYARRPNFYKTLKGTGDYDLQRILEIKSIFGVMGELDTFYNAVMSYATLKYALFGLINGRFSTRVLYADQNLEFFEDLAASDFANLISFFIPYAGFEIYFRWSPESA